MKIGSLFSGIGGLEAGLEAVGVGHVVWQVEADPYCRRVLHRHWPTALRYSDVRFVGAHCLPLVDVVCGGFPCQDLSLAGRGAGLEGARSGLWLEFLRVLRELRPSFAVVENVLALRRRGLDRVLGGLAEAGFDAEWHCLRASDVGAPHRRERLFILAHAPRHRRQEPAPLGGDAPPRQGRRLREPIRGDHPLAHTDGERVRLEPERHQRVPPERRDREPLHGGEPRGGALEPMLGRSLDGFSDGMDRPWPAGKGAPQAWWEPPRGRANVAFRRDRLRALGNAVVPQVAAIVGRRLLELHRELGAAA